jgi:hypothetical protein
MKHWWLILAPALLATPALAEEKVTFAELQGASLEATFVIDQVVRRNGREIPVRVENDWKIQFHAGDVIHHTTTPTVTGPRGQRKGAVSSAQFTLGKSQTVMGRGGGQGLYTFSDGNLVFMRTFKKGAFRMSIAFAHQSDKLGCTVNASLAREGGVGGLEMASGVDGQPIAIMSYKQVSSVCHLKKQE